MKAAMSSSVWLNEATAGSPTRMIAIAAATGSTPERPGDLGERAARDIALR